MLIVRKGQNVYDPSVGRFITEDPSEFEGGDYNLYRYCNNDPIDLTDPTGLCSGSSSMGSYWLNNTPTGSRYGLTPGTRDYMIATNPGVVIGASYGFANAPAWGGAYFSVPDKVDSEPTFADQLAGVAMAASMMLHQEAVSVGNVIRTAPPQSSIADRVGRNALAAMVQGPLEVEAFGAHVVSGLLSGNSRQVVGGSVAFGAGVLRDSSLISLGAAAESSIIDTLAPLSGIGFNSAAELGVFKRSYAQSAPGSILATAYGLDRVGNLFSPYDYSLGRGASSYVETAATSILVAGDLALTVARSTGQMGVDGLSFSEPLFAAEGKGTALLQRTSSQVTHTPYQVHIDPITGRGPMAIDTSMFTSGAPTSGGGIRNPVQFWSEWSAVYGDTLSTTNRTLISEGLSPVVDGVWTRQFPEHAPYLDEILIHHHLDYGPNAIPLPESVHAQQPGWSIWHQ
jgi:hypothetical protein